MKVGWGSVAELAFDAWSVGRSVGDDIMRGNIGLDRSRLDACCKGGVTSVVVEVMKCFYCSVIPGR